MVDHTPRYRPYDLDVDIHDKALTDRRVAPYKFEPSVDSYAEDSVPAFLSDYDGEPDPSKYMTPLRKNRRRTVSARILAGVLATAAAAILFAMFSSDATRAIIVNAKASIAASLPAYAALQPDRAQLTAHDTQLRNPNDAARYRRRQIRPLAFEPSQRPRWGRRVRKSRRPTRVRCRTAAPPPPHRWPQYRQVLQRRLPQRRRPRHRLPLCRRHLSRSP